MSIRIEEVSMPTQRVLFDPVSPGVKPHQGGRALRTAGLFAGIGGIEIGLRRFGHSTSLLCEIDPAAQSVLRARFRGVPIEENIKNLRELPPDVELVAGGFPCQDLSQAGPTIGIEGERSGLVGEIFRLLRTRRTPWVLLENVSFMLQLQRGRALEEIVATFEELGYFWAYRVVDSRFTGIPQRRERVYIVATTEGDPRRVLLSEDAGGPNGIDRKEWWEAPCGFYWTEGLRGLGWTYNAVPTLKGGSTIGIPSPPAIIFPDSRIGKPDIRDAERLQGFAANWTQPAEAVARPGHRWKLIGNAVTVDVAAWIGERLANPMDYDCSADSPLPPGRPWPRAAWGHAGHRYRSNVSSWPRTQKRRALDSFLRFPIQPLSRRAAAGFRQRTSRSSLRFPPGFLAAVDAHIRETS